MWSKKTQPTPANYRKRLEAAIEAIDAADELALRHGGVLAIRSTRPLKQAKLWCLEAVARSKQKG